MSETFGDGEYRKRKTARRFLSYVLIAEQHATTADIYAHGHNFGAVPICCCETDCRRSDACNVNAQIIREEDAPKHGYRLEHSYDSPDHWLRCIEGDAKSLIGPGAGGWDAAAGAMREHWWQEHGR